MNEYGTLAHAAVLQAENHGSATLALEITADNAARNGTCLDQTTETILEALTGREVNVTTASPIREALKTLGVDNEASVGGVLRLALVLQFEKYTGVLEVGAKEQKLLQAPGSELVFSIPAVSVPGDVIIAALETVIPSTVEA
jgi:hypothetical protein